MVKSQFKLNNDNNKCISGFQIVLVTEPFLKQNVQMEPKIHFNSVKKIL